METIICSAIQYTDIESNSYRGIGPLVLAGYRHADIIAQCSSFGKRQVEMGNYIQGFLTSKGRFVDRIEAAEIFNSYSEKKSQFKWLYSEDLY